MKNINIAFCFDNNQWMQAGVAITSLLTSALGKCAYNIYAFIAPNVNDVAQNEIAQIVKNLDKKSKIEFINVGKSFDKGFTSRYLSTATYFRLLIATLLPKIDKIIYADVDLLFQGDLLEMDKISLGKNILAGAKDNLNLKAGVNAPHGAKKYWQKYGLNFATHAYINAGVLIMNLAEIRKEKLEKKWLSLISENFAYHDQDILNITCQGKVKYIAPEYNAMVLYFKNKHSGWEAMCRKGLISNTEYENVLKSPKIVHFVGEKPWNTKTNFFDLWWFYASLTKFYATLQMQYLDKNLLSGKTYYLFGKIPFARKSMYNNKIKYYLFGICILKTEIK